MTSVHAFPDEARPAAALAQALSSPFAVVKVHRFTDGETLPTVTEPHDRAILYRSLHDPNLKLVETLLAADALRRAGAAQLTLVTPYLPYLRQDRIFHFGEPLSRDVVLPILASTFDCIVAVDPHLHRTPRLEDAAPQTRWIIVSGAKVIGRSLAANSQPAFDIVVGPDVESAQWVQVIAAALGAPYWTFHKHRDAARQVTLRAPTGVSTAHAGARFLLVDDVCSSGGTLIAAAEALVARGAHHVEAVLTHALYDDRAAERLRAAGVARVRSCDGCSHPSNTFSLAPDIAAALRAEHIT